MGTWYISEIAWDEARPYSTMLDVTEVVLELCKSDNTRSLARKWLSDVRETAKLAEDIGYGWGDDLADLQYELEDLAGEEHTGPDWSKPDPHS